MAVRNILLFVVCSHWTGQCNAFESSRPSLNRWISNLPTKATSSSSAATSRLFRNDALSRVSGGVTSPFARASCLFSSLAHQMVSRRVLPPSFTALESSVVDTEVPPSSQSSESKEEENVENEGLGAWLPIASIKHLSGLGPQKITVMDLDLVVWESVKEDATDTSKKGKTGDDVESTWTVQVDACTHRLAPLSQGRIDPKSGCIECPYHGWQFDTDGKVTEIPQLDATKTLNTNSEKTSLKTFPTYIAGDLLFAFLPSSLHGELFPQSLTPEQYYPYLAQSASQNRTYYVRELPYSFDFLLENFMDPAHIPFAHHSLQGTRDDGSPINTQPLVNNFTHIELAFQDVCRNSTRECVMSFQRPSFYHFRQKGSTLTRHKLETKKKKTKKTQDVPDPEKFEPRLHIYAVPVRAGRCRVFLQDMALPFKIPKFLSHAAASRFLNTDIWLHDAEREVLRRAEKLEHSSSGESDEKNIHFDYQYMTQSDLGPSQFRDWWMKNGMATSPPHTFGRATLQQLGPVPLTRREQIDPWENHAKTCSLCRTALTRLKKGQAACLVVAVLSAIVGSTVRKPILAFAGAALGLYVKHFLQKLATVIEGNPEPSGVADRSVAHSS